MFQGSFAYLLDHCAAKRRRDTKAFGTVVRLMEQHIPIRNVALRGDLVAPEKAVGLVLFAHGSGSGRKSSRNRFVASILQQHGIGTLLFDLLTEQEEILDARTAHLRFDIPLLAGRLVEVTQWVQRER